ncbi:MAG: serine hydrolase [Candidatus Aminicenantes bacterium]|nr:serine hydrolase [Candidatus Aminicenantes bacterium]
MNRKAFAVIFAALLLLGAFARVQASGKDEALIAQRIKGVENSLIEFNPDAPPAAGQAGRLRPSPCGAPKLLTLAERMAFYKVPGVSIAVINHNRIEWTKGYGVLKAGSTAAVTPGSFFEAASTTKAVVAAIVLNLVQKGKLDLDADVNQYLKSWRIAENDFTKKQKVTLRLLLTHRAGLPMTNFPYAENAAPPTLLQVLKGEAPAGNKAAVVQLLPGSKWQYSNIGYVVIQQLLEDVLAKPLEQIARERVFGPLGMASSTFVCPLNAEQQKNEALPHDEQGVTGTPGMHPTALAQGGLITTPADLARFTCELLLAYQGRSQRLLAPAMFRRMLNKEVELDPHLFGFPVAEGLGVFVMGSGKGLSFSHPGQNYPGATSWLLAYPELSQGAVIMTNGVNGEQLTLEIIAALSSIYGWPQMK